MTSPLRTCRRTMLWRHDGCLPVVSDTESLLHVSLGAGFGLGVSFGTDDARPSDHFAHETPSPIISLV